MTESRASAFRTSIAAMLQENVSLESLYIVDCNAIKAKEYVALITGLQHNTALKTIVLRHHGRSCHLTGDEVKQMAVLLKKNYALESLPDINLQGGDAYSILRLNKAGRRYLIQDGSSISKGVKVLSRVSNDISCVFLHLLENPRLCDRSAVDMVSASQSNGTLTTPNASSGGEKREQANAHRGNESRRRLA